MNKRQTNFACPVCQSPMVSIDGDSMNRTNGVTVYCDNKQCPAQECFGHHDNDAKAYEIVLKKYS
jgi:NAD-dependent DNA ligase